MSAGAEVFFVDTNLLLYSLDPADPVKRARARDWMQGLWETGSGRLSWQVLNEFYVNAAGKMKLPKARARDTVETLIAWQPVGFSAELIQRAWHWTDHAGITYWDALIVAAAESAGCRYLLSEDFQESRKFGALTVLNP